MDLSTWDRSTDVGSSVFFSNEMQDSDDNIFVWIYSFYYTGKPPSNSTALSIVQFSIISTSPTPSS